MAVITITRMFGSGGSDIARRVADSLGWPLLDNAVVEQVAARLHTTPLAVESIEEGGATLAERLADALAYSSPEVLSTPLHGALPPAEERVLAVTRQVVDEAVSRGSVVLLGRGAQVWLEHRRDALHVLCTAPQDTLVERVAAREGGSFDEARRRVDEENRRRAQFVRRCWGREWLDASHYHLCVNTGWLGLDGTARLVVRVADAHGLTGGPSPG